MEDIVSNFKAIEMDWTKVVVISFPGSWLGLDSKFSINPKEFLRYAKDDFKEEGTRGLVNALGNAKRAMDCQVDVFIHSIFLNNNKYTTPVNNYIEKNSSDNNGNKNYRLIESLGVAPSGIIGRYRELRNKLEHFYETPDKKLVQESIELAELLISTIDNAMKSNSYVILTHGVINSSAPSGLASIHFSNGELILEFYSKLRVNIDDTISKFVITPENKLFMPLIKCCLLVGTEIGWDTAVKDMIALINPEIPYKLIMPRFEYG